MKELIYKKYIFDTDLRRLIQIILKSAKISANLRLKKGELLVEKITTEVQRI